MCGIPVDSQYFDDSSVAALSLTDQEVLLARFELPPQYCGVLEYFAQFTDVYGRDPSRIATPGLRWVLLVNKRPLYPYTNLEHIVNPWGNGSFQVSIRLDESAVVEFSVRRQSSPTFLSDSIAENDAPKIKQVGGRIVGRYWYNAMYG